MKFNPSKKKPFSSEPELIKNYKIINVNTTSIELTRAVSLDTTTTNNVFMHT